ncbi:secreted protein [gut metagenome]|uniref:Secreted protein n=1 Tax=gut metagenome TaxID=749906 RepID=J9GJP7_9ZZZZ
MGAKSFSTSILNSFFSNHVYAHSWKALYNLFQGTFQ